jgi:hypothetical protein
MPFAFVPPQHLQECMASEARVNYTDQVVTPELAQHWLKNWNKRNRSVKASQVLKYANEMKTGRWTRGSRIIFYNDGVLCDGQNRLSAVVVAQQSIPFDVLIGAGLEEGANIDMGARRSSCDALRITGASDWIANKDMVATVSWIARNGPSSIKAISHAEVRGFAEANKEWLEPIAALQRAGGKKKSLTPSAYYVQLACALRHGEQISTLYDFHDRYTSGENYDRAKNAVIRLREYCLADPSCWTSSRTVDTSLRAQRAIKAFIDGQHLDKLYAPSTWIYKIPSFR